MGIGWLAFFFLIPLLYLIEKKKPWASLRIFFAFAFTANIILLYWIPRVMVKYGQTSTFLGVVGLLALAVYLALYTGLAGLAIRLCCRHDERLMVLIPFIWVAKDLLIEKAISGFPWCLVGYSQYKNLWFVQSAEIGGIHLISFWVILVNVLLYRLIKTRRKALACWTLLFFLALNGLGYALLRSSVSRIQGIPVHTVGIIQPNSNHDQPFTPGIIRQGMAELFASSKILAAGGAELVIWPEFTVPIYPLQNPFYLSQIRQFSQEQVPILAGFTDFQNHENVFNSAILFQPDRIEKYDKVHLTPFGEYVLFRKWLFFVRKITDEIGDFTPGKTLHNLEFEGHRLAVPICYEIIFPELVRRFVSRGSDVIITISNDSWFGKTSAPYQHLAMATMRGIENRRYVLRATSNGISALVSPQGRILYQTGLATKESFLAKFRYLNHQTLFTRGGYLFPYFCWLVCLFWPLVFSRLHGQRSIS